MKRENVQRRRSEPRAFTLIELLVVIAIIALLVSILLPSLGRAREQGKQAVCLANLKGIGYAMTQYFMDEKDWFPFAKDNSHQVHCFYYGGHPGRQWKTDQWWGYIDLETRDTPGGRPFNRYIYPDMPTWDVQTTDPMFDVVRKMPMYMCPSDTGGYWGSQDDPQDQNGHQLYYECGNSYDFNYHFVLNWAQLDPAGPWQQIGNAFVKAQQRKNSSQFVIIFEDPFDLSQTRRIPMRGWHKETNRHDLLFLDSHAANVYTDTTKGNRGLGWKTASGESTWPAEDIWWSSESKDPDNQYRCYQPAAPGCQG
jgi:prepilin-type N-terminal cleavage/methylation domain-containing protein